MPVHLCYGCKVFYGDGVGIAECHDNAKPSYKKRHRKTIYCPCVKCLLKPVCSSTCDEFERYRTNFMRLCGCSIK